MRITDNRPFIHDLSHESTSDDKSKVLTAKIIQFGTGVLLRGLPDYYIDQANRMKVFNGSVILVKSTTQGDIHAFQKQNNLYTIQTEGIEKGKTIQHRHIITCISKILTAQENWNELLNISKQPNISFIISNTTESGIVEVDEDLTNTPISFPGRLTSLLYQRYLHFEGNPNKGWIILPTELIENNADRLKDIVISIASKNTLPIAFIQWIESANHFCNTLVDRIVPGKVDTSTWTYKDELAIAVEPFNLWAIEVKSSFLKEKISFANGNPGIKLVDSIQHIKELKLRLLNASHTLLCPIALIARHAFVRESLSNPTIEDWLKNLMQTEIKTHLLSKNIKDSEIDEFKLAILDRFKNPFIDHKWHSISQNSTQKWIQRVLPIHQSWNNLHQQSSISIALSMACYLKCHQLFEETIFGIDPRILQALHSGESIKTILSNKSIWTLNLKKDTNFAQIVTKLYHDLDTKSVLQLIN